MKAKISLHVSIILPITQSMQLIKPLMISSNSSKMALPRPLIFCQSCTKGNNKKVKIALNV